MLQPSAPCFRRGSGANQTVRTKNTMAIIPSKWVALLGSAIIATGTLCAQSVPATDGNKLLLDTLVKKGYLTQQEADQIGQESAGGSAASGGKVIVGSYLKDLKISGDVRLRFEDRGATQAGTADNVGLDRLRYRFRLGLIGDLSDTLSFGLRLDTNSNDRSSNVTFGTNNTTGYGPWSKGDAGIYLNQIYVTYKPGDWTFTGGRMPLPLTTTNLVWYQDMSPEGLNEQYKGSAGALDYRVNLAQFIYGSPAFNDSFGATASSRNIWMLAWQTSLKYNLSKTDFVQVSPVLYNYVNASQGTTSGAANPAPFTGVFTAAAGQQQAVNDLSILEVPFEYDTMAFGPTLVRFFGDVGYNFDAKGRANRYGRPDLSGQDLAYQIGVQYGKAAKAGEWDAKAYWQQIDLFALDPNLVDPDIADSLTNLKGWAVNGNYYLTNSTFIGSTISAATRANNTVGTGGLSQDTKNAGVPLSRYWLYQLDLNVKF